MVDLGARAVSDNAVFCICVAAVLSVAMLATHSLEPLWLLMLLIFFL